MSVDYQAQHDAHVTAYNEFKIEQQALIDNASTPAEKKLRLTNAAIETGIQEQTLEILVHEYNKDALKVQKDMNHLELLANGMKQLDPDLLQAEEERFKRIAGNIKQQAEQFKQNSPIESLKRTINRMQEDRYKLFSQIKQIDKKQSALKTHAEAFKRIDAIILDLEEKIGKEDQHNYPQAHEVATTLLIQLKTARATYYNQVHNTLDSNSSAELQFLQHCKSVIDAAAYLLRDDMSWDGYLTRLAFSVASIITLTLISLALTAFLLSHGLVLAPLIFVVALAVEVPSLFETIWNYNSSAMQSVNDAGAQLKLVSPEVEAEPETTLGM